MENINQLSALSRLQQLSSSSPQSGQASSINKEEFLSVLKNLQSQNSSDNNNISGAKLNTYNSSSQLGTQALVSSRMSDKNMVYDAIDTVNNAQIKANRSTAAYASGYGDELQVTMDISKAEKYLQFFSEVRVKLVNAVKELSRTQI